MILESTYDDCLYQKRSARSQCLKSTIAQALADVGSVLIPAFSIGRTQVLLYELEHLIHGLRDA